MRVTFTTLCFFLSTSVYAQMLVQQPRADGAMTPLMIYGQTMTGTTCTPVVVISHGAGGSERGYVYLAEGLAKRGWLAIVPGHKESGLAVATADIKQQGSKQAGLQTLVADTGAYVARLEDVAAALDYAAAHCTAKVKPFRALAGHSMGAETVMLEAGAKSTIPMPAGSAGKDRFDAYVAMSPGGAEKLFTSDAWAGIRKPMFDLTGTLDGALYGGAVSRQEAYAGLPGDAGCDWLGVIDGAIHTSFAGRGPNAAVINPEIVSAIASFLEGARAGKCALPPKVAGFRMESK